MLEEKSCEDLVTSHTSSLDSEVFITDLSTKWEAEATDHVLESISFKLQPGQLLAGN